MTKIYLDMDGVLADFDAAAEALIGGERPENDKWPDQDWRKIKQNHRWFRNLPKMPVADELVGLARKFRDNLGYELLILTAIPKGNDFPWAFYDKVLWAQENYPDIPVHFGPYSSDKKLHCQTGDILVDDRRDNCEQWSAAGGIAVRFVEDYKDALAKLYRIYDSTPF